MFMPIENYRHPFRFFCLASLATWVFWFAAACISHFTSTTPFLQQVSSLLIPLGLCGPASVAFFMIRRDQDLRIDVRRRMIGIREMKPIYLFGACFLMLASILLAMAISLFFGYSADQFRLSDKASFSAGFISGWFLLLLAPFMEELGWHTYGTDSLRRSMNLLKVCLLFGCYWALWHMPLALIKGSYQSNLTEIGLVHSLNYFMTFFAYVILVNWLYYKANRSILVAIVFHLSANCSAEIFSTHPDSKVIQTGLLLLLAVVVIFRDRDFFLQREYRGL